VPLKGYAFQLQLLRGYLVQSKFYRSHRDMKGKNMLQNLSKTEMEMVSGGCPLDLRNSGLSAEEAAALCAELNRTGELVRQIPSAPPLGSGGAEVDGAYIASRLPRERG